MNKIDELAQIFAEYKIYPQKRYDKHSPVRVFQKMFPGNHYSKDLETFLSYQDYKFEQRGADLPWWGRKYFGEEKGSRTMIIAQDSEMPNAGSIALFAQLFPVIDSLEQYKKFVIALGKKGNYGFAQRFRVKKQIINWGLDFDFLYITDASKVYENNNSFNKIKSKELLEREIDFCNPSLIILLGAQPLYLLDKTKKFGDVVGKNILIKGRNCAVAPFITGLGISRKDFKPRLAMVSNLIKELKK